MVFPGVLPRSREPIVPEYGDSVESAICQKLTLALKANNAFGGGFWNANSAVPYENPTALSNFLELLFILLIPAALTYTFGRMVKDQRARLGALRCDVAVHRSRTCMCLDLATGPKCR
jgi:K+-transporting ATPase A subunit